MKRQINPTMCVEVCVLQISLLCNCQYPGYQTYTKGVNVTGVLINYQCQPSCVCIHNDGKVFKLGTNTHLNIPPQPYIYIDFDHKHTRNHELIDRLCTPVSVTLDNGG